MNEEQQILAYLNRSYQVFSNRFVTVNGTSIWGEDLCNDLYTIFSFDLIVCETVLKQWAIEHSLSESEMGAAWFKPRLRFTNGVINAAFEPKKNNRFIIGFPESFGISSWVIQLSSRPSMKIHEKKFLGFSYSKKLKWEPIRIEMLDPIGPSTTQRLMSLINNNILTKFDFKLEMLDPTGVSVEEWKVNGCEIKSIDFGDLGYDNDGMTRCVMVVQPTSVELIY